MGRAGELARPQHLCGQPGRSAAGSGEAVCTRFSLKSKGKVLLERSGAHLGASVRSEPLVSHQAAALVCGINGASRWGAGTVAGSPGTALWLLLFRLQSPGVLCLETPLWDRRQSPGGKGGREGPGGQPLPLQAAARGPPSLGSPPGVHTVGAKVWLDSRITNCDSGDPAGDGQEEEPHTPGARCLMGPGGEACATTTKENHFGSGPGAFWCVIRLPWRNPCCFHSCLQVRFPHSPRLWVLKRVQPGRGQGVGAGWGSRVLPASPSPSTHAVLPSWFPPQRGGLAGKLGIPGAESGQRCNGFYK